MTYRSRSWTSYFHVKVVKVFFEDLILNNPFMDLNYMRYDDRYWFEILFSFISTPGHDLQVKVTDLKH